MRKRLGGLLRCAGRVERLGLLDFAGFVLGLVSISRSICGGVVATRACFRSILDKGLLSLP
jgi:hypothetical protein